MRHAAAGAGAGLLVAAQRQPRARSGSQTFNVAPAGGAPWPNSNVQATSFPMVSSASGPQYGAQVIQMGTFSLSVNGTQVCADNASFAYNV